MSSASQVHVIVNPASGRGRGARVLERVRAAFGAVGISRISLTSRDENESLLARRAIDGGATTLVAVGGDGTWSNVANALLHTNPDCRLALIAAGTGNDFAKTAGVPARDIEATARLSVDGPDTRIDVGRVEDRYFLNALGVGFDVAVLERCARTPWLNGDALYLYAALRELTGYRGIDVDVNVDGTAHGNRRHLLLVVANGRRFGGSFQIAPDASLLDGLLDVVAIHDASSARRLHLFSKAVRGTHGAEADVRTAHAASLELRFSSAPAYDVDGEYLRHDSNVLSVSCVPGTLRIVGMGNG
ncbi:MAG: diacylglycerol kinase family protein [Gemmatimonadota bacterium]